MTARRLWWAATLVLPAGLLLALLVMHSLGDGLRRLGDIVASQGQILLDTGAFGALTAFAATGLGWVMAHVQHSYRFAGRRLLHWLGVAPMLMPSFTFAMALVVMFGHNGVFTRAMGFDVGIYGLPGLVIAGTLARLPYAYLMLLLVHRQLDPHVLDAARQLRRSRWWRLRAVIWPRVRLALCTVWLSVFADTVADLANPLVIGGGHRVVASRLYEAVRGEGDVAMASAYAILLLAPVLLHLVFLRLAKTEGLPRVIGREEADLGRRPQGWAWLLVGLSGGVAALVALLCGVVWTAAFWGPAGPGFGNFAALLVAPHREAIAWSVLLQFVVVPLVLLVALGGALLVAPRREWIRRVEALCRTVSSVPPLVLGFAAYLALVALRAAGADSRGWHTALVVGLMVLVLYLRSFPGAALAILGETATLTPELRGTASSLGVRGWRLVRLVYLPRLRWPMREWLVLGTARTLTATSSVLLLTDLQVPLMTARMLIDVESGQLGAASAMTVAIAVMVALAALAARGGGVRG